MSDVAASVWALGKRRMAMLVVPGVPGGGASVLRLKGVEGGVPGSAVVEEWVLVGSMPVGEFDRA